MADGPIQPPKTPPTPPNPILQAKPASEPNAQIVKLPPGLPQETKQPVHIRGEVIRTNNDGTVRIRTDRGDIDVHMDPKQMPREGQDVDVELQPGQPPQVARVATTEEPAPQRPAEIEAPLPRAVDTPVDVELRPPEKPAQSGETPQRPDAPRPATEQLVKLEQITLQQALELTNSPLKEMLDPVLEPTVSKIKIIINEAREVITTALHALMQTEKPVTLPNTTPPTVSKIITPEQKTVTITAPDLQTAALKTSIVQTTVQPQSSITTTSAPSIVPLQTTQPITIPDLVPPAIPLQTNIPAMPDVKIATPEIDIQAPDIKTILKISAPEPMSKNEMPNAVTALVIGYTPKKLPVVAFFSPEAPQALETASFFIMQPNAGTFPVLTPGDEITLIPQDGAKAVIIPSPVSPLPLTFLPLMPGLWPVMNEIYQALAQAMPQAAQAFSNMSPSPANPSQLGPTALFFVAAIRGGDLTQWLGERNIDVIRRAGKSGLISRIASEGSTLNRLSSEPISQDWRGMSLPLYHDGEMHKLALYYKHESQNESNDNKGGKQVRFLFDLSLDNMGKVQLDGLFRQKRLDLIVRSEAAFSQSMQQHMRRAYVNALEQTQVSGELSFQNKPEQWVTIKSERKGFGTSA
jgi:hypothetical protein